MKDLKIRVTDEAFAKYMAGQRITGSLQKEVDITAPNFDMWGDSKKQKDKLIHTLEHGWVKESKRNIKFYESVNKAHGLSKLLSIIARETDEAKVHITDWAMNNNF